MLYSTILLLCMRYQRYNSSIYYIKLCQLNQYNMSLHGKIFFNSQLQLNNWQFLKNSCILINLQTSKILYHNYHKFNSFYTKKITVCGKHDTKSHMHQFVSKIVVNIYWLKQSTFSYEILELDILILARVLKTFILSQVLFGVFSLISIY